MTTTQQLASAAVAYWLALVWSPRLRWITGRILRAVALFLVVTLGRTGAGLRWCVSTAWRRRKQVPRLDALNGTSDNTKEVAAAARQLAELLKWDATPIKWRPTEYGREIIYRANEVPDATRVSVVLCRYGVDAPIGRLTVYRDRYDDSANVHVKIQDRAVPKRNSPTRPTRPVRKAPPRVSEPTRTETPADPYVAAITNGAQTNTAIALALGLSKSTVSEGLKRRQRDGLIQRVGLNWQVAA